MKGVSALKLLEVKDLHVSYADKGRIAVVLDNINLSVDHGSIMGIAGVSGAGKTTLLRTLNLLQRPDSGRVVFDGIDITTISSEKLRILRRRVGVIFQSYNLFRSKTVLRNIAFPLLVGGIAKKEALRKAREIAEELELTHRLNAYPSQLSGGEQQRVSIARAIVTNPKMILLDEPTSALDPVLTSRILRLIRRVNSEHGITVIVVTHDMDVVKRVCDEIAYLEKGKMIFCGPTHDYFSEHYLSITRDEHAAEQLSKAKQLLAKRDRSRLVRLVFWGEATVEPILWRCSSGLDVTINIIYGEIEDFKHGPFGTLLIGASGGDTDLFLDHLSENVYKMEVLDL
ncbi:MAG: ABC-type metal ion transport system, ATPase component [Thermotogales bacterium 46_20]|nr:MAG: ABC-type metal ion transport system, ATPase component [Thermotogales bacterium 46_20]